MSEAIGAFVTRDRVNDPARHFTIYHFGSYALLRCWIREINQSEFQSLIIMFRVFKFAGLGDQPKNPEPALINIVSRRGPVCASVRNLIQLPFQSLSIFLVF